MRRRPVIIGSNHVVSNLSSSLSQRHRSLFLPHQPTPDILTEEQAKAETGASDSAPHVVAAGLALQSIFEKFQSPFLLARSRLASSINLTLWWRLWLTNAPLDAFAGCR